MVEAFAVASGKGGTGKTTTTVALGMALAEEYDVTVVDADTGMANLLFHTGLTDADATLHDLLVADESGDGETGATDGTTSASDETTGTTDATTDATDVAVEDAVYERFGMSVVPCGTGLADFEAADPERLREVVAQLAEGTDVLLLDSPAALGSKSAVLPVVLADRVVVVLQPTIPALSDGLKVQEYAHSYGTDTAGVVFNKVHDPEEAAGVAEKTERYFEGPTLTTVPDSDAARAARRAGEPLLAHAPESDAAEAYREAARNLDVRPGESDDVADRFRSAVVPDSP